VKSHLPSALTLCALIGAASGNNVASQPGHGVDAPPPAEAAVPTAPVVRVTLDTSRLVDLPAWGTNAVELVETWAPRIARLLGDAALAAEPSVQLVIEEGDGVAATSGSRITVFAGWIRAHPEDVGLVVHELVHVVQAYPSPDPGWVTEGLADYIRFWHFEKTPQTHIDRAKASYRDGYRTTGAFFAWLERRYPGTVKRLHRAMRESKYQDEIFRESTGQTVDELWKEFLGQWRNS
jgi:hypothetical protein